jgi:glycosyltransferase involved in cell wall biosynthesis
MSRAKYVIITPARNEAEYIQKTIDAVARQTIRPEAWIVVDDGSTDATPALIDAAAIEHPWLQPLHRADRGFRRSGGGVIEAFYDGYKKVEQTAWDYVVKLDADLSFEPAYFSSCIAAFEKDAKLGIGGGTICALVNGELASESAGDPPFHVRGATKIYRRACWEAIGGLVRAPGWDTLDEVKANMLGWTTYSFPELKLHHFRPAGDADGVWKNWVKNGRANYVTGYHPIFMLCKCFSRLRERPYGVVAAALFCGFFGGYLQKAPQVQDRALVRYLRQQQIRRMTFRDSLWARKI